MTTRYVTTLERRLHDYVQLKTDELTAKVKEPSGAWKEKVLDAIFTEYLTLSPIMKEATPAAIGEYAVLFSLTVEYITERPCMTLMNGIRNRVRHDIESFDRNYRSMLKLRSGCYSPEDMRFIAKARPNSLSPLHLSRPPPRPPRGHLFCGTLLSYAFGNSAQNDASSSAHARKARA